MCRRTGVTSLGFIFAQGGLRIPLASGLSSRITKAGRSEKHRRGTERDARAGSMDKMGYDAVMRHSGVRGLSRGLINSTFYVYARIAQRTVMTSTTCQSAFHPFFDAH